MASRQVNDLWIDPLLPTNGSIAGLLETDATGSSKASVSITTQAGGATGDILARLQGSNDAASWFDIVTTDVMVGAIGAKTVAGDVKGYAFVRLKLTRNVSTLTPTLISASINTGL